MIQPHIIIVAAGSGLRFGAPLPKQFCLLNGRPVVMHTVDAFRRHMPDATISLVISEQMNQYWLNLCKTHNFISPQIVFGGSTRWHSVKNAIEIAPASADVIMVHDAVRPIVTADMLSHIIDAFNDDIDAVLPVVQVTDTIRQIVEPLRSVTLPRASLRAVQTPQAFRADILSQAYSKPFKSHFTDDASVVEDAGFNKIALVEGSTKNIKITNPGDIDVAALYL